MFDIGGLELLVIAAIALIVVGPKELPGMVRNVGRWVSRARQMAREFQQGMEDAAKEADLDELRKVGSLKGDLERKARDFGESLMEGVEDEPPARRAPRAPERRPVEDHGAGASERASSEPATRGSGYASPPSQQRRSPASENPPEGDDALDRFQRGMRGAD